jgi:hypothetical protein
VPAPTYSTQSANAKAKDHIAPRSTCITATATHATTDQPTSSCSAAHVTHGQTQYDDEAKSFDGGHVVNQANTLYLAQLPARKIIGEKWRARGWLSLVVAWV